MLGHPFHPRTGALIHRLAEKIQTIESASARAELSAVETGWGEGASLAFDRGCLHEWFSGGPAGGWLPPLMLFTSLARAALVLRSGGAVLWIGRLVRPSLAVLIARGDELLRRSMLVDASDLEERVWAIDVAVRSQAVAAVIADGRGLDLARSRRLQLGAQSGGALVLLARPEGERCELSCAATRWAVRARRSEAGAPQWEVECLRRKGVRRFPAEDAHSRFILEWNRATGCIGVAAGVGERSRGAAVEAVPARRHAAS